MLGIELTHHLYIYGRHTQKNFYPLISIFKFSPKNQECLTYRDPEPDHLLEIEKVKLSRFNMTLLVEF